MNSLILYIERELTATFSVDSIIDDFNNFKMAEISFSEHLLLLFKYNWNTPLSS